MATMHLWVGLKCNTIQQLIPYSTTGRCRGECSIAEATTLEAPRCSTVLPGTWEIEWHASFKGTPFHASVIGFNPSMEVPVVSVGLW